MLIDQIRHYIYQYNSVMCTYNYEAQADLTFQNIFQLVTDTIS